MPKGLQHPFGSHMRPVRLNKEDIAAEQTPRRTPQKRNERRAEELRDEGLEEARAQTAAAWTVWNESRLEADAAGATRDPLRTKPPSFTPSSVSQHRRP